MHIKLFSTLLLFKIRNLLEMRAERSKNLRFANMESPSPQKVACEEQAYFQSSLLSLRNTSAVGRLSEGNVNFFLIYKWNLSEGVWHPSKVGGVYF